MYAAMDWLARRQDAIEAGLARRHLGPDANPARMAAFDLSSSWLDGRGCPLAARGYSRDGKKSRLPIEYGLLTDPAGRPVADLAEITSEDFPGERLARTPHGQPGENQVPPGIASRTRRDFRLGARTPWNVFRWIGFDGRGRRPQGLCVPPASPSGFAGGCGLY